MVWGEFEPKQWKETDVDIRITHCGVCGSDTHTLRSGWVSGLFPSKKGRTMEETADMIIIQRVRQTSPAVVSICSPYCVTFPFIFQIIDDSIHIHSWP